MKVATRLLLAMLTTLTLSQCAQNLPPVPPSLELPRPVTDLKAVRKGDKVYLRWTAPAMTTDGQTIVSIGKTRVCRVVTMVNERCDPQVGEVAPAEAASADAKQAADKSSPRREVRYIDTLPPDLLQQYPAMVVTYAVEVPNANGRAAGLSNKVKISAAGSLQAPSEFKARVTAEGVVLSWLNPAPMRSAPVYRYRIYRREEGSNTDTVAGEVPAGEQSVFVDRNLEWQKTYFYHATSLTQASLGMHACPEGAPQQSDCASVVLIEGEDTDSVKVFADDIFPPAVPSGLQAVFSGVGQQPFIDLIWSPGDENDLAGYNLYRNEEGGQPAKINAEPIKLPAYRDSNLTAGRQYFYSVSAIDLRGNESACSEPTSERVP